MQIICKKKLQFNDYNISVSPLNRERVAKLVRSFIAGPSLRTIEAPDWIVNDDLFNLAIADGSLIPVGTIPDKRPKPVIEESSHSLADPMQTAAELTEADLALLNRPVSELIGATSQQTSYPTTSTGWPSTKSI
jgi:hypothetical protein